MNWQFPKIFRPFFRNVIWRKSPSEKVIYLTFDDGPVPEVTPQVLDILDKYGCKATFFCVGENVEKYPQIYAELINRGHRTGNHTFNHIKGFEFSSVDYVANVQKAAQFIDSKLFRPPYGRITRNQINALKSEYEIIMWDIITHDYKSELNFNEVLKIVTSNLRNGSIIVFHDSIKAKNNVLQALPLAIEFWKGKGYRFGIL